MSECEKPPADKHHLCTKEGWVVCPDVQRTTERHHPLSPLTLPHFTKTLQDIHHSYMQAPTRLTELPQTNCSESIKTTCTIQLTNYISLKYIGPTKSPTVQPRGEGGVETLPHARNRLNSMLLPSYIGLQKNMHSSLPCVEPVASYKYLVVV